MMLVTILQMMTEKEMKVNFKLQDFVLAEDEI